MKKIKKQSIPQTAFMQVAADVTAKADESGNYKFSITALGGEVLEHWWFGPIIQDLSGMQMAGDRIPLDYNHDSKEIIGFAELKSTGDALELNATIVPYESDRGAEIIHKLGAGVPYQASIDYTPTKPDEILYEYIDENEVTQVNGKEFQGPLTVVRKWILHGLAICPHGADSDTSVKAQQSKNTDNKTEVSIMENKVEEKEVVKAVEVQAVDPRAEFRQFVAEFGMENASNYFEQGLDMVGAQKQFLQDVKAELETTKQALVAKDEKIAELEVMPEKQVVDGHFETATETVTFTRQSIAKMTRSEYEQNREAIMAACKKGEVK